MVKKKYRELIQVVFMIARSMILNVPNSKEIIINFLLSSNNIKCCVLTNLKKLNFTYKVKEMMRLKEMIIHTLKSKLTLAMITLSPKIKKTEILSVQVQMKLINGEKTKI